MKKKITIKTAQIDKPEFAKAESGKEFKLKFITQVKPVPPIDPTDGDGGNRGNDVVQPPRPPRPTVADAMKAIANLTTEMRAGFKDINTRLGKQDSFNNRIETTLSSVIKLNNLKH